MEPTVLTTERLVLRPHVPADVAETHAACQDPEIQRWIPVPVPYEEKDAVEYVTQNAPDRWREGSEYNFAVRLRRGASDGTGAAGDDGTGAAGASEGPLVATLGIHPRGEFSYEIGFWAVAGHRGRGYTTEAVLALARWAFTELGCDRLIWRAGIGNTASRAVAEKAGFTIEGVQRSGMEHRGTLRDCWLASLLPSDMGLPSRMPYLPTPERAAAPAAPTTPAAPAMPVATA
ncbi:GNAT family N-acetyltransferase [Streptomyces sp. NRRL S-87]|uniref:GNAT family N-acetyltransferase n=1 Tax=Streptomyces sp. NRRL S-87 TaxID=1463920 RepID=UPI0004C1EEA3|nr:GNAT family N-acetyltransferase [Streptomyces sp. NRRL S-87]